MREDHHPARAARGERTAGGHQDHPCKRSCIKERTEVNIGQRPLTRTIAQEQPDLHKCGSGDVARGGVEPPTFRFSGRRSGVPGRPSPAFRLVGRDSSDHREPANGVELRPELRPTCRRAASAPPEALHADRRCRSPQRVQTFLSCSRRHLGAPRGAVHDAAASARAGRAACRPVPARRAAAPTKASRRNTPTLANLERCNRPLVPVAG